MNIRCNNLLAQHQMIETTAKLHCYVNSPADNDIQCELKQEENGSCHKFDKYNNNHDNNCCCNCDYYYWPSVDVCNKLLIKRVLFGRFCRQTTQQWKQVMIRGRGTATPSFPQKRPQLRKYGFLHVYLHWPILHADRCTQIHAAWSSFMCTQHSI